MNPTPKQSFIKLQELRSALEKFVVSKEAGEARNYALLQFIEEQPNGTMISPNESCDRFNQLLGARKVLEILYDLPFATAERKFDRLPNLAPPK